MKNSAKGQQNQVYQYLMDGILSGKWEVGEKLPSENELCNELSVSRNTVRSAIGFLAGAGVIETKRGKGSFVCNQNASAILNKSGVVFSAENVDRISVFEFRKAVECECAVLAAVRATTEEINAMADSIRMMESSTDNGEIARYDMEFHRQLVAATKNKVFIEVFDMMYEMYSKMFEYNVTMLGNRGAEHHRRILMAFQARDMKSAQQSMLFHLEDTMRVLSRRDLV